MNVRLPLVLGALVASSLGVSNVAEAQRARVHFSGGASWSGGVSVTSGSWHFARPAWRPNRWHVSGSIYVGPRYYYPRPYYVYYPTYVPSYYATTSYYPVAPVAAPGAVAVAAPAPRPELPRLGIGLFFGGSAVESQSGGESMHESDNLGLIGQFRLTPGLILEGEIGKMSYDVNGVENARVDRRLGAALLYEIGAYNRWAPYVLAGIGVQQAEVGGEFVTTQDYGELGIGLRWAASRNFHLAAEFRAGARDTVDSESQVMTYPGTAQRVVTPPTEQSDEQESYTLGRVVLKYFF